MTLEYYFEKYGINPENIVWIARDRATYKTIIHMISGREIMLQRINVTFIRTELEGRFLAGCVFFCRSKLNLRVLWTIPFANIEIMQ